MNSTLRSEGSLLAGFVPGALVGEHGVIFITICAAVLQREGTTMVRIECFLRFTGFVGQSGSFMLIENIALNYSPFFNSSFRALIKQKSNGMQSQ